MDKRLICWLLCLLLTGFLLPQAASAQDTDVCAADVAVQSGDTLSLIASRHLGDLAAYPSIVAATNAKAAVDASYATIENANFISVGWKLCNSSCGWRWQP